MRHWGDERRVLQLVGELLVSCPSPPATGLQSISAAPPVQHHDI